jgi:hypothetical protein
MRLQLSKLALEDITLIHDYTLARLGRNLDNKVSDTCSR